jgi:hypothetical protein
MKGGPRSRKIMKGGLLGRIASALTGKELTVHQKAKNLAYGRPPFPGPLKSFSEFGYFDFKVEDEFGNKPELVSFAGYMINGFYGIINVQTENDVIALRRLFQKFKKGGANLFSSPLKHEWEANGKPAPIFGNIMNNAKNILEKAGKKGLLRSKFSPSVKSPEYTAEAMDAVRALNEADNARVTGRISAAEFADAIGAITYDATPYTTNTSKKTLLPSFLTGARMLTSGGSRKNKKTYKNKNRKNKRKNNTRKYN